MGYAVGDQEGRSLVDRTRDDFIGWPQEAQVPSLQLVTNNSRYLIMP